MQADSLPAELQGKSTIQGNLFLLLPDILNCLMGYSAAAAVASVVSDSVRPHGRQPTRLPRPWESPGKNTGVGCYFLLQCMKVKSESEVAQSCPILATPWTAAYQAPPPMGFSRQKYWSGVPLASPMGYSKSGKWISYNFLPLIDINMF